MAEIKSIRFDDGRVPYAINGDRDRLIYIHPTDTNLPKRYHDACECIRGYAAELKEKYGISDLDSIAAEGTGDTEKDIELIYGADAFVKSQINHIFGYDVCAVAFGEASCLSVSRDTGLPLYVGFLDALTGIIKEEFGAAAEKFKAAMDSPRVKGYTDQYQ